MTGLEKADCAIHQLIGYSIAKRGFGIICLIEQMNLELEEWNKIKKYLVTLTKDEVEEVDNYFKVC